jgi:hypothetical protein
MPNRDALWDPALPPEPGGSAPRLPPDLAVPLLDDLTAALNRCVDAGMDVSPWNGILATPDAYVICVNGRWVVRLLGSV